MKDKGKVEKGGGLFGKTRVTYTLHEAPTSNDGIDYKQAEREIQEKKKLDDALLEANRLEKLKKQATAQRKKSKTSSSEEARTEWVFVPSFEELSALWASLFKRWENEGESTTVTGEVLEEQLALKGPQKKIPIDPKNVVNGVLKDDRSPIEKLRDEHPLTRAGTPKREVGK